jgi:hypothetical protein
MSNISYLNSPLPPCSFISALPPRVILDRDPEKKKIKIFLKLQVEGRKHYNFGGIPGDTKNLSLFFGTASRRRWHFQRPGRHTH